MVSILKKHSIVYVEDEPKIQMNIAEYLENYFGKVHLASDGQEALNQYSAHHPDVMLLDINLPTIDGLTVARKIRENDPTIKIIILTAFTEKEKLLKAIELNLTKYLIKPVAPKSFKETLEALSNDLMTNPSRFLTLNESLVWDKTQEQLIAEGRHVIVSEKEHRLLKLFIRYKGEPVTYEKITMAVWDNAYDRDISIDSIKNQVSQLRKRVPNICINSVYGEGYILK